MWSRSDFRSGEMPKRIVGSVWRRINVCSMVRKEMGIVYESLITKIAFGMLIETLRAI